MDGKHYDQKARDRKRQLKGMELQSRRDWLTWRCDRLGLTEEERRELATYALDHQIPMDELLSELERLKRERDGDKDAPLPS